MNLVSFDKQTLKAKLQFTKQELILLATVGIAALQQKFINPKQPRLPGV